MGHWTVFCAITHAPIKCGDRCVGIFTEVDKDDPIGEYHKVLTPFYRGEYDSYGDIDFDGGQDLSYIPSWGENQVSMFILESVFDEVIKGNFNEALKEMKRWEEFYSDIGEPFKEEFGGNLFSEQLNLSESLFPLYLNESTKPKILEILKVRRFMRNNNLNFGYRFPYGPQDGDFEAFKKLRGLVNLAYRQLKKEQDSYKEWERQYEAEIKKLLQK